MRKIMLSMLYTLILSAKLRYICMQVPERPGCKSPQKSTTSPPETNATHMLTRLLCCICLTWPLLAIQAQFLPTDQLSLSDLSGFDDPPAGWQIAGGASADLDKANALSTEAGTGVLVNLNQPGEGDDLFTTWTHGDLDLSLDFMMPPEGNSGIYLMGRYEIQLADSWGKPRATYADCGGIYQRWDDTQPSGQRGYEGHAPRINACRAPGLWQHLKVTFRAPRFDKSGQKTEPARLLRVMLNGAVIHENVELTGPTRGSAFNAEAPEGPLRIQGDHGPVAFRDIRYERFAQDAVIAGPFDYKVYLGKFRGMPDLDTMQVARQGQTNFLTQEVAGENKDFLLKLEGTLLLPRDGEYRFEFNPLGFGQLRIDGKVITPPAMWRQQGRTTLTAGEHQLEIIYGKDAPWYNNGLALHVSGPQLRRQALHMLSSMPIDAPDNPVYVEVGGEPRIMRCFIDYRNHDTATTRRIVHAINVGFPNGQAYTFDPDRAAWVQVWRGDFLDAGPMWISRGDGSSRPKGSLLTLGDEAGLGLLISEGGPWPEELPEALDYEFVGYQMSPQNGPTFQYRVGKVMIRDAIRSPEVGSLTRTLTLEGDLNAQAYLRLARGQRIEEVSKRRYRIDQHYYLELMTKNKPLLRTVNGQQELLLPLPQETSGMVEYQLMW